MKRVAAIFLLLCCLMSIVPMAYAVGRSETAKAEAAEETQQENEVLGVIEGSTAIRTMHVEVKLDEKGRAFVTQTIEMNIIGEPEELRFSVPDYAKKIKVKGYRAKNEKERGVRYCVIKDRKGFDDEETFVGWVLGVRCWVLGGEWCEVTAQSLPGGLQGQNTTGSSLQMGMVGS